MHDQGACTDVAADLAGGSAALPSTVLTWCSNHHTRQQSGTPPQPHHQSPASAFSGFRDVPLLPASASSRHLICLALSSLGPCWAEQGQVATVLQVAQRLLSDLEHWAPATAATGQSAAQVHKQQGQEGQEQQAQEQQAQKEQKQQEGEQQQECTAGQQDKEQLDSGEQRGGEREGRKGDDSDVRDKQLPLQFDQKERERLARFCSLAGCLVAILQAVGTHVPVSGRARLVGLLSKLLPLLLAVQQRAAAVAAGGADHAARRLACEATRLALISAGVAGSLLGGTFSLESTGEARTGAADNASIEPAVVGHALAAAADCLRLESLPRQQATQLQRALAAFISANGPPPMQSSGSGVAPPGKLGGSGAAMLQEVLATAWPGLMQASRSVRMSPHADVLSASAAVLLAALRQGHRSLCGAAACKLLLQEAVGLKDQLIAGGKSGVGRGGSIKEVVGLKDQLVSDGGQGVERGSGVASDLQGLGVEGRPSVDGGSGGGSAVASDSAGGDRDSGSGTAQESGRASGAAPGGGSCGAAALRLQQRLGQLRLLAFDMAVLEMCIAGGGDGTSCSAVHSLASTASSVPLDACLEATRVALALLRAGDAAVPLDAELAVPCVRLLAAVCERTCVLSADSEEGPDLGVAISTGGSGTAAPLDEQHEDDEFGQLLELISTAGEGLAALVHAPGVGAATSQDALQAIARTARAAPRPVLRAAAAARAGSMARLAAASRDAGARLAAVAAAETTAHAALEADGCGSCAAGGGGAGVAAGTVALLLSLASDAVSEVAAAACGALCSLALSAYLLAAAAASGSAGRWARTGGAAGSARAGAAADPFAPASREVIALQRQLRGFRPAQLAAVFEDLLQASPSLTLLTKRGGATATGGGTAGEPEGGRAVDDSLLCLARELPVLPSGMGPTVGADAAVAGAKADALAFKEAGQTHAGAARDAEQQQHQQQHQPGLQHKAPLTLDPDQMSSCSEAAWYLVQEAARHCVTARMKTHLGGPTQSFAALEKVLQGALARLQSAAAEQQQQPLPLHQQQPPPLHQKPNRQQEGHGDGEALHRRQLHGAVHLLEFVFALEAGIHSASEGCMERAAPSQGVMAFFVANKRVRLRRGRLHGGERLHGAVAWMDVCGSS